MLWQRMKSKNIKLLKLTPAVELSRAPENPEERWLSVDDFIVALSKLDPSNCTTTVSKSSSTTMHQSCDTIEATINWQMMHEVTNLEQRIHVKIVRSILQVMKPTSGFIAYTSWNSQKLYLNCWTFDKWWVVSFERTFSSCSSWSSFASLELLSYQKLPRKWKKEYLEIPSNVVP